MVVHRTALWITMLICCLPSVAYALRVTLGGFRQHAARPARLRLAGALVDGVLTGIGVGLGVAFAFLLMSSLWVRLFDA